MGMLAIFGHSSSEKARDEAIAGLNTGDMVMTDRVGGCVHNFRTKVILFMGSIYSDFPGQLPFPDEPDDDQMVDVVRLLKELFISPRVHESHRKRNRRRQSKDRFCIATYPIPLLRMKASYG
jgi:hypothetical protein